MPGAIGMNVDLLLHMGLMLAGAGYLAFAVSLIWTARRRPETWRASLVILVPALITVAWAWSEPARSAAAWSGADPTPHLDAMRYASWFATMLYLMHSQRRDDLGAPRMLAWALPLAAGLLGFALWGSSPFAFTLLAVFGLVLTEQLFRNLPADSRWSVKPICIGLAGTFLFDFYLFSEAAIFHRMDPDAMAARGFVHALMVPFLFASGLRQRNWMTQLQLSRTVVFHSVAVTLAGLYLLFIAALGYYVRYFGGDWGRALQLGFLFIGGVLMVAVGFSGTLRAKVRVWLGKHFFRYRYDYRDEWLKFTRAMSSHSHPDELNQQVIRGLADMVESPAGGLWMKTQDQQHFRQVARWNLPAIDVLEPADSSLARFIGHTGWVINLVEYAKRPDRYAEMNAPAWLSNLPQAWLLVPLRVAGDNIGFVVLANSRTSWDVNWEVTDLLKTAATQAASFLAQMQAAEALLESRKFESFNRMSAFVVHDLKNIVTQLSLMMKNARRLKDNPEFQEDMLMTIEHALDRMKQMMLQLREGAAPASGAAPGVDLSAMAREWAQTADKRGRTVALDLKPDVLTRGHAERLQRVVGHLIQNALDATEDVGGHVWVRSFQFGSHACLEVGDNGVGMSPEFVSNRLFKPFQSTKAAGMGIGAYESAQYIQELGGKMTVDSREGHGTVITLVLPLFNLGQTGVASAGATA
jgi:putative PEP-CTERM system histidine kinase